MRHLLFGVLAIWAWVSVALAQSPEDVVWVQIESHPSLQTAQERARIFSGDLRDVNGFALGGGWYGIALGPYRRRDAEQVLRVYRADGLIPRDSYLALSTSYRQQFWPVGANVLNRGVINLPETPQTAATEAPAQETEPAEEQPVIAAADETPAQARRSEQQLTREERRELQTMLQWAGFYTAAIDGAFGRGTRRSMSDWQAANNHEPTGILTTAQRAELKTQYNAVLDGLGLRVVSDEAAGVSMLMPTAIVEFDAHDYPFARYDAKDDSAARVLLISQAGDRNTLFGLYEIMQTLEIVPLDGARERKNTSFVLTGENTKIVSHTEVALEDGQIKGFTLVWPAGDEERRTRMLAEMRNSFERIDGVLDHGWSNSDEQAVDLVSGLQIRRPRLSRSGFFATGNGAVITSQEAVGNCGRITLNEDLEARISAEDSTLGIAVLSPESAVVPIGFARFSATAPRLQSEIAVAGFSYEGVLGAPTMTFGTLTDLRGLQGESGLARLNVELLEGDAGGPVFDGSGGVLGMVLPRATSGRQLPAEVTFAADADAIRTLLSSAGLSGETAGNQAAMAPEDITTAARDMTVLVSCWD